MVNSIPFYTMYHRETESPIREGQLFEQIKKYLGQFKAAPASQN